MVLDKPTICGSRAPDVVKIDGTSVWYFLSLAALDVHGCRLLAGTALVDRPLLRRDPPQRRPGADARHQYVPLQAAVVHAWPTLLAAFAGSLYAFYTGYIEPSYLDRPVARHHRHGPARRRSARSSGPVVGAFVLTGLPHVIEFIAARSAAILYGAILILTILLMPRGIVGTARELAPCCLRSTN